MFFSLVNFWTHDKIAIDWLFGKAGNVSDLHTCQGNVRTENCLLLVAYLQTMCNFNHFLFLVLLWMALVFMLLLLWIRCELRSLITDINTNGTGVVGKPPDVGRSDTHHLGIVREFHCVWRVVSIKTWTICRLVYVQGFRLDGRQGKRLLTAVVLHWPGVVELADLSRFVGVCCVWSGMGWVLCFIVQVYRVTYRAVNLYLWCSFSAIAFKQ